MTSSSGCSFMPSRAWERFTTRRGGAKPRSSLCSARNTACEGQSKQERPSGGRKRGCGGAPLLPLCTALSPPFPLPRLFPCRAESECTTQPRHSLCFAKQSSSNLQRTGGRRLCYQPLPERLPRPPHPRLERPDRGRSRQKEPKCPFDAKRRWGSTVLCHCPSRIAKMRPLDGALSGGTRVNPCSRAAPPPGAPPNWPPPAALHSLLYVKALSTLCHGSLYFISRPPGPDSLHAASARPSGSVAAPCHHGTCSVCPRPIPALFKKLSCARNSAVVHKNSAEPDHARRRAPAPPLSHARVQGWRVRLHHRRHHIEVRR